MNIEDETRVHRTAIARSRGGVPRLVALLAVTTECLLGAPKSVNAAEGGCEEVYELSGDYPRWSELEVSSALEEALIILHVEEQHVVVEHRGCFYALAGAPIEVAMGEFEEIRLRFDLHGALADASVVVVSDDHWHGTFAVDGGSFEYSMRDEIALHFFVSGPGPGAPVVPIVVRKPVEMDPDPR